MADREQDADPARLSRDRPLARAGQRGGPSVAVITDARSSASAEMSTRVRRYAITMGFRTACFLSMIVVEGWMRWVLLACAVFLPYVAVVLANQSDQRTRPGRVERGAPANALGLTTGGRPDPIVGEVLHGSVEDDRDGRKARVV